MKIKWNRPAFEQLRRLPAVEAELDRRAEQIETAARDLSGVDGYLAVSGPGKSRSRAAVITSDVAAMRDNAANNTLLRALGSVIGQPVEAEERVKTGYVVGTGSVYGKAKRGRKK